MHNNWSLQPMFSYKKKLIISLKFNSFVEWWSKSDQIIMQLCQISASMVNTKLICTWSTALICIYIFYFFLLTYYSGPLLFFSVIWSNSVSWAQPQNCENIRELVSVPMRIWENLQCENCVKDWQQWNDWFQKLIVNYF